MNTEDERRLTATEVMLRREAEKQDLILAIAREARRYQDTDPVIHELFEKLRVLSGWEKVSEP